MFTRPRLRRVALIFSLMLGLVVAGALALRAHLLPAPPPSQVFFNAQVLTMDGARSVASAVLIERERIVAVGSDAEIRARAGAGTVFIDLEGNTLLPGFIEAHGHFPGAGLSAVAADLSSPPVGSVRAIEDALERLRAQAKITPRGEWVLGFGYDDTLVAEGRNLTREDLDAVSREHPVYVLHSSGHFGVINSRGLARVDIGPDTPDPPGGEIRRAKGSGRPTGLVLETANDALRAEAMRFSARQSLAIVRAASSRYLSQGFTTVQNGLAPAVHLSALAWVTRLGLTPLRVVVWPDWDAAQELLDASEDFRARAHSRYHVGAVKLIVDGSIQGYTAYLGAPYYRVPDDHDAEFRGEPRMTSSELTSRIERLRAAGLQVAIHGNGDAAIEMILDALELASARVPMEDPRTILVHAQMARPDQLQRMYALGVTPSFFSAHVYYWGDRHRTRFLGPERAARISQAASASALGLRYTLHLDTPVVPPDPLLLAWSASSRVTRSGAQLGGEERISAIEALRAITIDAAWQVFLEDERGSIEPGKLADMVVLSGDPLAGPEALREARVLRTVIGGVTVFLRAERPS